MTGQHAPLVFPPRLAATVAILRDGPGGPEVLLTRRPSTMAFGPGLHVFPGGAVDPGDRDPGLLATVGGPLAGDPAGLHPPETVAAAIREAWEEAGVRLRAEWLVPHARWVTPGVLSRRFDARFFVAWLPDGVEPSFDAREVDGHAWLRPADALDAMAERRIQLWMPTSTTLQHLAGVRGPADLATLTPAGPPATPVVTGVPGTDGMVRQVTVHGAGAIPGRRGRAWLVGRQALVAVDPGDPSEEGQAALLAAAAAAGGRITAVALTAPDPERAAGAEHLALDLGVPLLAPAAARRVLACETTAVAPGERLGQGDIGLRVLATPSGRADAVAYGVGETGPVILGGTEDES